MKFSVVWQPDAIQELAAIWLRVADRNGITRATQEVDDLLSREPRIQGESRIGTQRVFFVPPLGIRFEVILDDLQVRVLAVWLTQRP